MLRATFPTRRCSWAVFLAVWLLASAGVRARHKSDGPEVRDFQRDGTGRVWGISWSSGQGLYTLDEQENWQPVDLPELGNGSVWAAYSARRADGTVVCLWKLGQRNYRFSEHLGGKSTLHEEFVLPFAHSADQEGRLFCDSKGGVWLTQGGPDLYRFNAEGKPESMYHVPDAQCLTEKETGGEIPRWGEEDGAGPITVEFSVDDGQDHPEPPKPTPDPAKPPEFAWDRVSVFEDAAGRLWFWTDHANFFIYHGMTIRGAVVYDGKKFVQHDFLLPGGGLNKPLTALAPKDPGHLWVAVEGGGLYTLDVATFQAERVPGQPAEAVGTTFVGTGRDGRWDFVMANSDPGGGSTLWQLDGSGRWDRLIDGVDEEIPEEGKADRLWIGSADGDYLGSLDSGLWFLPRNGSAAQHLDWRRGFPLAGPHRLLELEKNRWLGVSMRGQTWVGSPGESLAGPPAPDRLKVRSLHAGSTLQIDAQGHLWSTFGKGSRSLREWDGDRWIEHSFPSDFDVAVPLRVLNFDGRGRVWLRSEAPGQPTAIYDPATDNWRWFDSFAHALEAQGGRRDAEFIVWERSYDLPRYGPGGRICYYSTEQKFVLYDGHAWREWSGNEIAGGHRPSPDGDPFFDGAGRLTIGGFQETWQYTEGAGWRTAPAEHSPAWETLFAHNNPPGLPSEVKPPFQPDRWVQDNQGTWWLTCQRQLYKARPGLCVPVFKPGETQPFITGLELKSAFVDARGHAFLFSVREDDHAVAVILSPDDAPQTTATEEADLPKGEPAWVSDQIRIRLATNAAPVDGKARYEWRLDGGAWTALASDGPATVQLEALPAGAHRFEARSFDPTLQTDLTPAVLAFEVRLDSQAQVAGYIAQLADPDEARRKAAVVALTHQPALALPALRAARAKAPDDPLRWWIDAALQGIDTAKRNAAQQAREPGAEAAR